ncbi:RHS repeat protein [Actinotalea sp. C106]|uniref:RHS repeat protein n=1 Tax=Actinotalea sp. C106 TaxID=2908644 RepID=UPI00202988D8|nr:RHS repeat protein [Actinotalea sp. C106]
MLANKASWPDVPTDLYCKSGASTCKDQRSPVFFDRYQLEKVATKTYDGSAYQPVDSWTLDQSYLNPNDGVGKGSAGKILWLKSITHTGHGGTAATGDDLSVPPVLFANEMLKNRVDSVTDGPPPMWRPRVTAIRTESGALTSVNYRTECTASALPTDARTNDKLCFPVDWDPEGHTKDAKDWFHKYVVESVVENGASLAPGKPDLVTGSGQVTTRYTYGGGGRWMKPTGALVKPKEVTYSDFRGYSSVTTTVGEDGEATSSTSRYFRGLGGQLTAGPAGHELTFTDHERFQGQVFSAEEMNGSRIVSQTVTVPSGLVTTATGADGTKATLVGKTTGYGFSFTQAGTLERRTRSTTNYDGNGQVKTVDDAGDLAVADDGTCTTMTYGHSSNAAFVAAHMVGIASRVEVVGAACGETVSRPRDVISDTLVTLDARGRALETWQVDPNLSRTAGTLQASTRQGYIKANEVLAYDAWGRPTQVKDALGRVTSTTYTHSTGGLLRETVTTSPDPDGSGPLTGLTSTTVYNPLLGTVVETRDPNGKRTTGSYDALGRLLEVRAPDRQGAAKPSVAYAYRVQANGLNSVVTRMIGADGSTQHVESTLYDGLMRPFQTQTESSDGGPAHSDGSATRGRVVAHTFYDTAGRVLNRHGSDAASL